MDYITQCYYSNMRPYRDRPDIVVPGRWRWCPDGAKAIPYLHRFGSHTMDWGEERLDPPVGEVPRKNGRTRGESSPRYTGQHFCGTEEDWTLGTLHATHTPPPVDADGIPLCCLLAGEPLGGWVLDGESDQHAVGGGGVEVGGTGLEAEPFEWYPDGGLEVGGAVNPPVPFMWFPRGGLQVDGHQPPPDPPPVVDTSRGLQLGGEAMQPFFRQVHPEGGVEFDAEGTHPLRILRGAQGGVEFGLSNLVPVHSDIHPAGGVELGGSGLHPLELDRRGAGGVQFGSGLVAVPPFVLVADGGVQFGGEGHGVPPDVGDT